MREIGNVLGESAVEFILLHCKLAFDCDSARTYVGPQESDTLILKDRPTKSVQVLSRSVLKP